MTKKLAAKGTSDRSKTARGGTFEYNNKYPGIEITKSIMGIKRQSYLGYSDKTTPVTRSKEIRDRKTGKITLNSQ